MADTTEGWASAGPPGSTLLDPDDAAGLIPAWVATRSELNEVELANIAEGLDRRRWRRPALDGLLDDLAVRALHRDLFGNVWRWAGSYRRREVTIGVDPVDIAVNVRDLVQDAKHWFGGSRPLPADDAGCRFHHALVKIHPFPNGNGRHARAMTDLLMGAVGAEPFSWGGGDLNVGGAVRADYIAALRAADAGDLRPLGTFVRR